MVGSDIIGFPFGYFVFRLRFRAGLPVGFHPCSTALRRFACLLALVLVVRFALTEPGVDTRY